MREQFSQMTLKNFCDIQKFTGACWQTSNMFCHSQLWVAFGEHLQKISYAYNHVYSLAMVAGLPLICQCSLLLQGLYVFVVYFILHNQTCCPMKASYTVEMNGHPGPSTAFFTPGSGMPPVGGEISKSTQNLISAMEEVPALALSPSLFLSLTL